MQGHVSKTSRAIIRESDPAEANSSRYMDSVHDSSTKSIRYAHQGEIVGEAEQCGSASTVGTVFMKKFLTLGIDRA